MCLQNSFIERWQKAVEDTLYLTSYMENKHPFYRSISLDNRNFCSHLSFLFKWNKTNTVNTRNALIYIALKPFKFILLKTRPPPNPKLKKRVKIKCQGFCVHLFINSATLYIIFINYLIIKKLSVYFLSGFDLKYSGT